jgi:hypothetical protein
MIGHWWMIVKALVRSQIDSCVLPGTLTGTEILLLYLAQWKRDATVVTSATFYLIFSQCDLRNLENVLTPSRSGEEQEPST